MNLENLQTLVSQSCDAAVFLGVVKYGEPPIRLYCDGRILCLAPEEIKELAEQADEGRRGRMAKGSCKLWGDALAKDEGVSGALMRRMGTFPRYRREYCNGDIKAHIDERFARIFNDSASFRISGPEKKVTVYEQGALVGIVMPIKSYKDEVFTEVTCYLPDDVIYHRCPDPGEDAPI